MKHLLCFTIIAICATQAEARVLSSALCADHYVLALAKPEDIVGLSHNAHGALGAPGARAYREVRASVEAILARRPDIVIVNAWEERARNRLLERLGVRVFALPPDAHGFDDIARIMRDLGAAMGREAQAEALIRDINTRRQRLEATQKDLKPRAVYLRPGGGGAAAGTYVDAALRTAGLVNLQTLWGQTGWATPSLERLMRTPPDILILSFFEAAATTRYAGLARHPLLRRLRAQAHVIEVPAHYWVCAGPSLIDAAEHIARALPAK